MSRPLRIEFAGALYHITARGDRREPIYEDDDDRRSFLDILGTVTGHFNWLCHAWCLMGNHYHLLVETPDGNLAKGMRQLNGVYTQGRIGATGGSVICFRGATRRSWWIKTRICSNCAATSCSTRSVPGW